MKTGATLEQTGRALTGAPENSLPSVAGPHRNLRPRSGSGLRVRRVQSPRSFFNWSRADSARRSAVSFGTQLRRMKSKYSQ